MVQAMKTLKIPEYLVVDERNAMEYEKGLLADAPNRGRGLRLADLQAAWQSILQRARLVQHHTINREQLSVREHMTLVLRRLQGHRFMEFESLFEAGQSVAVVVVMFVAILELAKEAMVQITQAESFAPIYLRLAYTPEAALAAE
jgi:segregation and condensation protein A